MLAGEGAEGDFEALGVSREVVIATEGLLAGG